MLPAPFDHELLQISSQSTLRPRVCARRTKKIHNVASHLQNGLQVSLVHPVSSNTFGYKAATSLTAYTQVHFLLDNESLRGIYRVSRKFSSRLYLRKVQSHFLGHPVRAQSSPHLSFLTSAG